MDFYLCRLELMVSISYIFWTSTPPLDDIGPLAAAKPPEKSVVCPKALSDCLVSARILGSGTLSVYIVWPLTLMKPALLEFTELYEWSLCCLLSLNYWLRFIISSNFAFFSPLRLDYDALDLMVFFGPALSVDRNLDPFL